MYILAKKNYYKKKHLYSINVYGIFVYDLLTIFKNQFK